MRVIDGDTIVVSVDLGFHVSVQQTLRLHGINAPEMRGSSLTSEQKQHAREATARLREMLSGDAITIKTVKDRQGKYGRYLAVVFAEGPEGFPLDVGLQMVLEGFASRMD